MLSVCMYGKSRNFMEFVLKTVGSHIESQRLDMTVLINTNNPAKIIRLIEKNNIDGLYFLELEAGEWDASDARGLEAARLIRKHDPRGFIVFLANTPDFLPLTFEYKLEALAYIQKTDQTTMRRQICECIDDSYGKHVSRAQGGNFIFKEQAGGRISCAFDDILFFETEAQNSKLILLHAKNRRYKFYGTMNDITKELPAGQFYRCHKSYVINITNLPEDSAASLRQGKDTVIMPNDTICYVSVRKKGGLLRLLETNE